MYGKLQQRPGKYMPGKFQYMHGKLQYMTGKLQQMPGKLHNMPGELLYIISLESYSICTPGKDTVHICLEKLQYIYCMPGKWHTCKSRVCAWKGAYLGLVYILYICMPGKGQEN